MRRPGYQTRANFITNRCGVALVATLLLFVFSPPIQAQEKGSWKFFRGDQFDGTSQETGLADTWNENGPPVLWSIDLGVGYSGFVGHAGRVYTQYQSLTGQYVICLNSKTGEKIWEHRYAWPHKPASLYPGPRSTPTINLDSKNGDRLFFTTPTGSVGCLDLATGSSIWQIAAFEQFDAPEVEFGYACSPVCIDGKLILPLGGPGASMVALSQKDGSLIWRSGDHKISYCSAYPIVFAGQSLIVGYFKNEICLFDQQTGEELASLKVSEDYDEHSAWPIYDEPYLWISGPFRSGCQLLQLMREGDRIQIRKIYHSERMSNDVASCVRHGSQLYGFDIRDVQSKVHRPSRGRFCCLEMLTGELLWDNGTLDRREMNGETISSDVTGSASDIGHASVIVADEKLILLNDTGQLIVGQVNSAEFVEIGRATVLGGEICWTAPMLIDRCVFARNHSRAVCVYLGELNELDASDTFEFAADVPQPQFLNLAPIILGTEPKFAMTAPKPRWLVQWYLISFGLGWLLSPVIAVATKRVALFQRIPISSRTLFLGLAFLFGILGTTIAGRWQNIFYFSWPISLAIAFECVVCQLKSRDKSVESHPVLARLALVLFLAMCVLYFWLCRRLSLAFEWTFLIGFPLALPFLWVVKVSVQRKENFGFKQWAWSALAFTVFYWTGAGLIMWKYAA